MIRITRFGSAIAFARSANAAQAASPRPKRSGKPQNLSSTELEPRQTCRRLGDDGPHGVGSTLAGLTMNTGYLAGHSDCSLPRDCGSVELSSPTRRCSAGFRLSLTSAPKGKAGKHRTTLSVFIGMLDAVLVKAG